MNVGADAHIGPPRSRTHRTTLNGTQFDANVGADAHIGPQPYEPTAPR